MNALNKAGLMTVDIPERKLIPINGCQRSPIRAECGLRRFRQLLLQLPARNLPDIGLLTIRTDKQSSVRAEVDRRNLVPLCAEGAHHFPGVQVKDSHSFSVSAKRQQLRV